MDSNTFYGSFSDASGINWSINFPSLEVISRFATQVAISKSLSSRSEDQIVTQDVVLGTGKVSIFLFSSLLFNLTNKLTSLSFFLFFFYNSRQSEMGTWLKSNMWDSSSKEARLARYSTQILIQKDLFA